MPTADSRQRKNGNQGQFGTPELCLRKQEPGPLSHGVKVPGDPPVQVQPYRGVQGRLFELTALGSVVTELRSQGGDVCTFPEAAPLSEILPSGWPKKTPRPLRGFAVSSMSCDITVWQVLCLGFTDRARWGRRPDRRP